MLTLSSVDIRSIIIYSTSNSSQKQAYLDQYNLHACFSCNIKRPTIKSLHPKNNAIYPQMRCVWSLNFSYYIHIRMFKIIVGISNVNDIRPKIRSMDISQFDTYLYMQANITSVQSHCFSHNILLYVQWSRILQFSNAKLKVASFENVLDLPMEWNKTYNSKPLVSHSLICTQE